MRLSQVSGAAYALVLAAGAPQSAHEELTYDYEDIAVSTERVSKLLASPAGWGDRPTFFVEKARAAFCFIEENKEQAANVIRDGMAKGRTFASRDMVDLGQSACFKLFRKEASLPRYRNDEFKLYNTTFEYGEFRNYVVRYVASCMWEKDSFFHDELRDVANPDGLGSYLASRYREPLFAPSGQACFPAYDEMAKADLGFSRSIVQQMLVRKELDR